MAITVENRLNGPEDTTVTDSSLSDSARTGTVTVAEFGSGPPGEATYQDTYVVRGLNMIEVGADYSREHEPRLQISLPSTPWWLRVYMRLPTMQDAGHGIDECRYVFACGDWALELHETAGGNIGMRLQPTAGLAQDAISPEYTGDPVPIDQVLRIEIANDGSSTVVRAFDRHETAAERICTWSSTAFNSSSAELSAYRYRRGVLLQPGMNDANLDGTPIEDRQNQLLDWDPNALPQFGADGDYGSETTEWVENFQTDHDLLVDGEIGPETGAAMDLAQQVANGTAQPPPVQMSLLAISDSSAVGPADWPEESGSHALSAATTLDTIRSHSVNIIAEPGVTTTAQYSTARSDGAESMLSASANASGRVDLQDSLNASVPVSTTADGIKQVAPTVAKTVFVTTEAHGEDTTGGIAQTSLSAQTSAQGQAQHSSASSTSVDVAAVTVAGKDLMMAASGDVVAVVSTDVQADYRSSATFAPTAAINASGVKEPLATPEASPVATTQATGTSHPNAQPSTTVSVAMGSEGAAGMESAPSGGVLATGNASGTKAVLNGVAQANVIATGDVEGTSETILPQVPIMGLLYRFIAYEPNGDRRGQLPMPLSFQLGVPFNDLASLSLEYVRDAPGASLLEDPSPAEVAVEFAPLGTDNYVEYPGCRFLNLRNQSDFTDRAGVRRYTMPNYGWQLRKVRNINLDANNTEHKREFTDATPGEIIGAFLSESHDRDNVPELTWDFTNQQDSNGNAWAHTLNVEYDLGQDLWSIVQAMTEDGLIDWRFDQRRMQIYNKDTTLDRDRTTNVILHAGRDVTEAPDDSSFEDLASHVMAKGVEGVSYSETNPTAIAPWGLWQDVITQSGVSDHGTLATAVQARLSQTASARTQMTRAIVFPTTLYLPFRDYRPGDTILVPGHRGEPASDGRVRQITISSVDPHSVEGNLTINDRFVERDLRMDRKLSALTGQTSSVGGSGGSPGEDTRIPQAPDGLGLVSDAYLNEIGEPRGQITAAWNTVDTAVNGTEMTIERYEVWLRHAVATANWQLYRSVDSPDTQADMSPFDVGEFYEVTVRAVGNNERRSVFSTVETITVASDTQAPPTPSDPILSTRLGVIRAYWDGLTASGTDMPIDFNYIAVYMSETGAGGSFEREDTLYRTGAAVIPNQPYDEERFFYFVAVDGSGNESGPSTTESIATDQAVSTDFAPGSVGYEILEAGAVRDDILDDEGVSERSIAAGAVTAEKVRAYSITTDRIAVGNSRNILADSDFVSTELNSTRLNAAQGDWSYESAPTDGNQIVTENTATDTTQTNEFYFLQSSEATGYGDPDGALRWDNDIGRIISRGVVNIDSFDSGAIDVTVYGTWGNGDGNVQSPLSIIATTTFTDGVSDHEISSTIGARETDAPAEFVWLFVRVQYQSVSPAGTSVALRDPFFAFTNGTVLIEDGAVSANKIEANAVTAGKIEAGAIDAEHISANAIETTQLAANAINAKHTITGAWIRTTSDVNRGVHFTDNGIFGFNSNGDQTFYVDASDGSVYTEGVYTSGRPGENRVYISADANHQNQAGVRVDSGGSGGRDSTYFIDDGSGAGGWEPYSVAITGSEVVRNSSGRSDLILYHGNGGGAELSQQHGSYGGIGVRFEQWDLHVRGRLSTGQHQHDMFIWGRSSSTSSGVTNWEFTYGATAPNGGRLAMVCGHGANTESRVVTANVTGQNRGNLFAVSDSDGTHRMQYLTVWVDQSVAGS